jgi:hypothetical protein
MTSGHLARRRRSHLHFCADDVMMWIVVGVVVVVVGVVVAEFSSLFLFGNYRYFQPRIVKVVAHLPIIHNV